MTSIDRVARSLTTAISRAKDPSSTDFNTSEDMMTRYINSIFGSLLTRRNRHISFRVAKKSTQSLKMKRSVKNDNLKEAYNRVLKRDPEDTSTFSFYTRAFRAPQINQPYPARYHLWFRLLLAPLYSVWLYDIVAFRSQRGNDMYTRSMRASNDNMYTRYVNLCVVNKSLK